MKKGMLIIFALILIFIITSCSAPKQIVKETVQIIATAAATTIPETTVPPATIVETTEPEIDMNKVKFWEAVVDGEKSYDILDKSLDYGVEELGILSDAMEGKIDNDEEISRFNDLSYRVVKDFFMFELIITGGLKEEGITPNQDMTDLINLMEDWANNTDKSYSYYAKYLETGQAEYDLKVDECKEKAEELFKKYLESNSPYIQEYNKDKGIK